MKIGVVGDWHIGARGGSAHMRAFIKSYLIDYMLPYYRMQGIKTLIQAGDMFDVRKSIYGMDVDWVTNELQPALAECEIELIVNVGNHDITLAESNRINWPSLFTRFCPNIIAIEDPRTINIHGQDVCMIPWINAENYDETLKVIEESTAKVAIGHLELGGFAMYQGSVCSHGQIDVKLLQKFDKVLTGHFHTQSNNGNIHYLGTPYHLNWQDYADGLNRGVFVYDLDTGDLEFKANTEGQSLFRTLEYSWERIKDDKELVKQWNDKEWLENGIELKGKIVKVTTLDRDNAAHYKKFCAAMRSVNCLRQDIIDRTVVAETNQVVVSEEVISKDSFAVIQEKVGATENIRKDKVMAIMEDSYKRCTENSGVINSTH